MTLFEAIAAAVERQPQRQALLWIAEDGSRRAWSAEELHQRALGYRGALAQAGLAPHDLVLLALPYDNEAVPLFLGAAYGAAVPALLPYFTARNDAGTYVERALRLATQSQARAIVCASELLPLLRQRLDGDRCLLIDAALLAQGCDAERGARIAAPAPEGLATVQFTSGTTGMQKGVRISHRAMLRFLDSYGDFVEPDPDGIVVSWLPLNHDMGLITGVLLPLVRRMQSAILSPAYWIRAPIVMLRLVDELRGTHSWMPNFAFHLLARSLREADLSALDLGSWRFVANGAELVRADSLEAFCRRLEPYGLRREAIRTGYGMAENVLTASITNSAPRVDWIDRTQLRAGRAVPVPPRSNVPPEAAALAVVSNGPPLHQVELRITDEHHRPLPDRTVGEVCVRSPHLFDGYHRNPAATAEVLRDGWFRSGDLGYLAEGELYLCGRKKDLIIVGGNNVHPEDVEAIADRTEGVQPGRAVAFGVADQDVGTERVILICELRPELAEGSRRSIDRALRQRVLRELDITLGAVHFVERGWIVKTTSGKHARAANRDKYLAELARAGSEDRP